MKNKEAIDILKELPDRIVSMIMPLDVQFDYKEALDLAIKVLDEKPQNMPIFNREVLEQTLKYWYDHLEEGNEEQNEAVWCAINTIRYCIENSSGYQKDGAE